MHVLVTGGAGSIGGHLDETFLLECYDETVLDMMDPFYDLGVKWFERHPVSCPPGRQSLPTTPRHAACPA